MEESQSPKRTGNRQLTEIEMALMNETHELGLRCEALILRLQQQGDINRTGEHFAQAPLHPLDQRWISIGATDLQKGFMAIRRGIAKPRTF